MQKRSSQIHEQKARKRWFHRDAQIYLLVDDHAAVALGEGGQQDPGGQPGGEGAPEGGEACAQLGGGGGGGRRGGGRLYQPSQPTHLQEQEVLRTMVLLSDIITSHGNILFLLLHEQTTINSVVTSLNLAMRTAAQTKESR